MVTVMPMGHVNVTSVAIPDVCQLRHSPKSHRAKGLCACEPVIRRGNLKIYDTSIRLQ